MKHSKLYSCLIAVAMVVIASANAMAQGFTLKNVTFLKPGEKATIALGLNNESEIKTMETKIILPEGISFVANDENGNYAVSTTERTKQFNVSLSKDNKYDNAAYLLAYSVKKNLAAGKGDVFTFDVNVDANYSGTKEIKLVSTDITTGDFNSITGDFTAKVASSDEQVFLTGDVAPITVGVEQTVSFKLNFEKTILRNFVFNIELPKGLKIVEDSEIVGSICPNHVGIYTPEYNTFVIAVSDPMTSDNFSATSGDLCGFKIVADETFVNDSEIIITNVKGVAKYEGKNTTFYGDDLRIKVSLNTTGINGIDADTFGEGADGIYQLNGVRTDKLQRGVNIVVKNGKAVKVVKK